MQASAERYSTSASDKNRRAKQFSGAKWRIRAPRCNTTDCCSHNHRSRCRSKDPQPGHSAFNRVGLPNARNLNAQSHRGQNSVAPMRRTAMSILGTIRRATPRNAWLAIFMVRTSTEIDAAKTLRVGRACSNTTACLSYHVESVPKWCTRRRATCSNWARLRALSGVHRVILIFRSGMVGATGIEPVTYQVKIVLSRCATRPPREKRRDVAAIGRRV